MQESFYSIPGCPCSIALISDLHEAPFEAVLASLRKNRPSLICVAGDFLIGRLPKEALKVCEAGLLPFFSACASLAPCFVSLGNHEWMLTEADLELLRSCGVSVLDNTFTAFTVRDRLLVIGGLSSARVSEYRRALRSGLTPLEANDLTRPVGVTKHVPPQLAWLDGFSSRPGYHILLCHHPEYYPRWLSDRRIDLILSGHAHGGQIRLFGRGLYSPGQGLLPGLTVGVVDGRLVISRGLANTRRVPRLFNPPELVYILSDEGRTASPI